MCFTLHPVGLHMVCHGANFAIQRNKKTANINVKAAVYTNVNGDM